MSKLFKDALDDAKKLREIAEQNATNKIIEAVAPRIKALIENELMDDELSVDDEFMDDGLGVEAGSDELALYDEEATTEDLPELAADDLVSSDAALLPSDEDPIDPFASL